MKKISMKNFLSSTTKESMARLALTWSLILASFMFIVISFYIGYSLYKGLDIEWYGLSTFVGSLASFIGVTVWGKVVQRKYEGGNDYNGYGNGYGDGYNGHPHNNYSGSYIADSGIEDPRDKKGSQIGEEPIV